MTHQLSLPELVIRRCNSASRITAAFTHVRDPVTREAPAAGSARMRRLLVGEPSGEPPGKVAEPRVATSLLPGDPAHCHGSASAGRPRFRASHPICSIRRRYLTCAAWANVKKMKFRADCRVLPENFCCFKRG